MMVDEPSPQLDEILYILGYDFNTGSGIGEV